jgi:hypothetical protein
MTHTAGAFAQDAATGRIAVIANAIAAAAATVPYNLADVAVAYATRRGVELLNRRLDGTGWTGATKRFLISVDFGVTEPEALAALEALPNAEVRVPNGLVVLASEALRPPSTFHTKAYAFRVSDAASQLALVVGSANITASALATGAEAVIVQTWSGSLSPPERALLSATSLGLSRG